MPKQIIAVDLDDTIFDEMNAVRRFHNKHYGTQHTEEDFSVTAEYGIPHKGKVWGTDDAETLRRYHEFAVSEKHKQSLVPLSGAIEVLQRLKQRYELVIITARVERAVKITHKALDEHYPNIFKDVHFAPLWGADEEVTKAQISLEIGAKYLIDDSFEHCMLAAEAGMEALVYGAYGWNRHQELKPGMTRVKDWTAVERFFNGRS